MLYPFYGNLTTTHQTGLECTNFLKNTSFALIPPRKTSKSYSI